MRKNTITLFFILILIGTANAETGHPYAPKPWGQTFVYAQYKITATWETTGWLSVKSREFIGTAETKVVPYKCHQCYGDNILFKQGFPAPCSGIVDAWGLYEGKYYLGEAVNQDGIFISPFLPKLTLNPKAGETMSGCSYSLGPCGFTDKNLNTFDCWTYRTLAHFDTWGNYRDVWVTSLAEYSYRYGSSRYNYAWARGVGLIHFWFTLPDGSGYELYATDWSVP